MIKRHTSATDETLRRKKRHLFQQQVESPSENLFAENTRDTSEMRKSDIY